MGHAQAHEVEQLADVVAALGVTITATYTGPATGDNWKGSARREWSIARGEYVEIPASAWSVTLGHKGRSMETRFHQGSAHSKLGSFGKLTHTPPTAADVLYCLASDASACEHAFEEWCADFGCDTDSRKAEATYRACQEVGFKVKRLLGEDFERVRNAEHLGVLRGERP